MPPPPVLLTLAALCLVGGLGLALRALRRVAAAWRARVTYGAPYRRGTLADRLLGLLLTLPLIPLGALGLWLALAQAAFQPVMPGSVVRVGRIDASRQGWARTSIRLTPDPGYPEARPLDGSIDGARWAVAGDFLEWAPGVRWLGLRPAQRVRVLLGSPDPNGTAAGGAIVALDAAPRAAEALLRFARYLPFLRLKREASPWFAPAEKGVVVLYATTDGYLADVAATGGGSSPRPPATRADPLRRLDSPGSVE